MKLLVALLVLLLIEIALFVVVGGRIGLWPTLAWVVVAGGLGILLLKGVAMMGPVSMSRDLFEFRNAQSLMPHRVLVVVAGSLLLIPGFFTDLIGLLLLIQPVRRLIIRMISRKFDDVSMSATGAGMVDGEWVEVDTNAKKPQAPANKTQH